MNWQCPLCRLSLSVERSQIQCSNGHSFDLARQGYVNLLPANFKQSKNPGDDKNMLQARRAFLDSGYYRPLLTALSELQSSTLVQAPEKEICALDMGGGDGYFGAALDSSSPEVKWYLTDISKDAVRLAAARFDKLRCAVASSFKLPIADQSLHWVLRNFAPSQDEEVARVLHRDGCYCVVTPNDDHLIELRRCLYQDAKQHTPPEMGTAFSLESRTQVNYTFELNSEQQRQWLLAMTPMAWRASESARQQWLQSDQRSVTANFSISLYRATGE